MLSHEQQNAVLRIQTQPDFHHWCIVPGAEPSTYKGPVQYTYYLKDMTLVTQRISRWGKILREIRIPHKEYR